MAEHKKRLGRGLDALLSSTRLGELEKEGEENIGPVDTKVEKRDQAFVSDITIEKIKCNPHQPRQKWDQEKLKELAESIKIHGLVQPVIVRPMGQGYQLIAGERRLRASQIAGQESIAAIIRDVNEEQMLEWALVENIHRADLNPLERAKAYNNFMERFSLTQQQVAQRLGEDRSTVANYIRLLDLSDEIRSMLNEGSLSMGHARALLGIADHMVRRQLALIAVKEKWSVRELEKKVQLLQKERPPQPEKQTKPLHVMELEQEMTRTLGTKVLIKTSGKKANKGKIVIEFYSLDDFDRIREILR